MVVDNLTVCQRSREDLWGYLHSPYTMHVILQHLTTLAFISFGKWNRSPLYFVVHAHMLSMVACMFFKMWAFLTNGCYHLWRWSTSWCTVLDLEYNSCIIVSKDNTSSSISFFSSAQVAVVTKSPPCLATYNSFAIHSFSAMRNQTLELVSSAYTLVASTKESGSFAHQSWSLVLQLA